jgi:hypothetical protein
MRHLGHVYTPFGNMKHSSLPGFKNKVGTGMGSVLLQTGGPGGASSYDSIADYTRTTGIDPRQIPKDAIKPMVSSKDGRSIMGVGIKSKIRALIAKPLKETKPKNISFML